MGGKKLCLAIDLGPAYIIQLSPNGKIAPESSLDYPEHLFCFFGGIKIGFRF